MTGRPCYLLHPPAATDPTPTPAPPRSSFRFHCDDAERRFTRLDSVGTPRLQCLQRSDTRIFARKLPLTQRFPHNDAKTTSTGLSVSTSILIRLSLVNATGISKYIAFYTETVFRTASNTMLDKGLKNI